MEIKTIDLENSDSVGAQLLESFQKTGFAIIKNHQVSTWAIEQAYKDWQAFFASKEKFEFLFDKEKHAGYFPFKSENAKDYGHKDLKEFFHIFNQKQIPGSVGNSTGILMDQLQELGLELLEQLDWAIGKTPTNAQAPLPSLAYNSPNTLMRVLHYPPIEDAGASVRSAAHEDINMITLLPVATTPGLQVKDVEGNWHEVGGDPNQIIVNVGDMLQRMTNGALKSTTHRVINPLGDAAKLPRYSIALFMHAHPDAIVAPGVTAQDYLNERLRELGLK